MRYGTKHKTDFSWFSKGSVPKWNKVFSPFRSLIRPPNWNPARKQTGKGVPLTQNADFLGREFPLAEIRQWIDAGNAFESSPLWHYS
jgi:hypothetical protein